MTQVYYAEDDAAIAEAVRLYLAPRGFAVTVLPTLDALRQAVARARPDIALLDWQMPDGRGDACCQWLRECWPALPIMLLTVRNETSDIVAGLACGADDYLTKPFALDELHARMQALLRRAGTSDADDLRCGALMLDTHRRSARVAGREVALTAMEYQVFALLMRNQGRTVTRAQLLAQVWDSEGRFVNDNTLTVTVKRLREKLGNPACLKTIRSFGYRMEDV